MLLRFGRRLSAVVRPAAARRAFSQQQQQPAALVQQPWTRFTTASFLGKAAATMGSLSALYMMNDTVPVLAADETDERREGDRRKMKKLHNERRGRLQELIRKVAEDPNLVLFAGRANVELAQEVADYLGSRLGNITVGRFADGEVKVQVNENVRGKDIYIFQPTCPPVNENLMELLLMVSTMRRASAKRITVIIPYYGYARQDRKMTARVPISAADVARLLEAMGIDRAVAVDLHCGQIQGFFGPRVPVDNLDGGYVGVEYFGQKGTHACVCVRVVGAGGRGGVNLTRVYFGGRW